MESMCTYCHRVRSDGNWEGDMMDEPRQIITCRRCVGNGLPKMEPVPIMTRREWVTEIQALNDELKKVRKECSEAVRKWTPFKNLDALAK